MRLEKRSHVSPSSSLRLAKPQTEIDLEQHRSTNTAWFADGLLYKDIASRLETQLQTIITQLTLKGRLKTWDLARWPTNRSYSRIAFTHWMAMPQSRLSDSEIVHILRADRIYGTEFNQRAVSKIRVQMGLYRRLALYERAQQEEWLREIIKDKLDLGVIE